jgi:hypothetical protein
MSRSASPLGPVTTQGAHAWVQYLPDGAVSIHVEDSTLVLHASQNLEYCFRMKILRSE